jgi:hypothetical protein
MIRYLSGRLHRALVEGQRQRSGFAENGTVINHDKRQLLDELSKHPTVAEQERSKDEADDGAQLHQNVERRS